MVEVFDGLIIGIGSAVAGSAATYFFTKRLQRSNTVDLYLDRFREKDLDHVGIFNFADGFIDACLVCCDDVQCDWWDGKKGPRSITKRGANALLPTNHDENPIIKVMCRQKKLRSVRFLDITPRT